MGSYPQSRGKFVTWGTKQIEILIWICRQATPAMWSMSMFRKSCAAEVARWFVNHMSTEPAAANCRESCQGGSVRGCFRNPNVPKDSTLSSFRNTLSMSLLAISKTFAAIRHVSHADTISESSSNTVSSLSLLSTKRRSHPPSRSRIIVTPHYTGHIFKNL